MYSAPPLPRTWFLHSRTFWLGFLVSAFFVWLTIDSHLYSSIIRTIHRGSWRDWSNEASIPPGTPAESGSLVLMLSKGKAGVRWHDGLNRPMTGYGGEDERRKPYPGLPTTWLPEVINERDSVMRCRGLYVPTWMFLAGWLGVWGWQLGKARRRLRSHLTPEGLTAS